MKKSGLKVAMVLGGAFLLAACSGGSSNLSDPPPETDPSTSCGSEQVCITGRFEDGQVTGLDYTCGNITAKTDSNGDFTCVVGSTIKFMIKHPDSVHEVLLGQALVQDALQNTGLLPKGTDGKPLKRIYLTALDLAGTKDIAAPEAAAARNITRLLHALNSSSSSPLAIKDNPARDIVLTEDDKKEFLVALNESISLTALSENDFEAKVGPALSSMTVPRTMLLRPDADRTIEKAIYSIMAGLYQDNGFIVSTETPFKIGLTPVVSLFYGYNANEELFGEVQLGVDRKGRFFGAGSASMGARNTEIELVRYDPTRFYPRSGRHLGLDGSVAGLEFDLENLQIFSMATGVIDRNFMAINETSYKNAYGVDVPSPERLGTLSSPSPVVSPYTFSGVNLVRPTNLVTTLNPAVWNELDFPLHVKATLKTKISTIESVVGAINFSILSDGNIVTDLDADCSDVDLDSLSDGDKQEQVMGVVGRVFPIDSRLYVEPLLVMPKTVEFGSAIANASVGGLGNPVRLRVDAGSNYLKAFKNTAGVTTDDKLATWVNKYLIFKNMHDDKEDVAEGAEGDFVTEPATCPIVP